MSFLVYKPLPLVPSSLRIKDLKLNRWYFFNSNFYAGVTSVLSETKDKYVKQRIDDYARKHPEKAIQWQQGLKYGTHRHQEWEAILKGKKSYLNNCFSSFFDNVSEVICSEAILVSKQFNIAGTIDGAVYLKTGELVLLDFKTSQKRKTKSKCYDYFTQLGLYSLLLNETYGLTVSSAQLLMLEYDINTLDEKGVTSFSLSQTELLDYQTKAKQRVNAFYQKYTPDF